MCGSLYNDRRWLTANLRHSPGSHGELNLSGSVEQQFYSFNSRDTELMVLEDFFLSQIDYFSLYMYFYYKKQKKIPH